MALKVKTSYIKEDIVDTEGNKIGEIKFNPKDSRIMSKLAIILNEIGEAANKIGKMDLQDIPEGRLEKVEDFEKFSNIAQSYLEATTIENNVIEKMINELSEIFGRDTVMCFTGGTNDIESLMPLIEYVLPYVKDYKQGKVSKYLSNTNDVME